MIDNSNTGKICAVFCFLYAKNTSALEIHRKLCMVVYGLNVMSEGTVRKWCRMFKDGRANVHDEERSGWPAICSE
jgi:hypothetical protein